jgi:hypothetical protein
MKTFDKDKISTCIESGFYGAKWSFSQKPTILWKKKPALLFSFSRFLNKSRHCFQDDFLAVGFYSVKCLVKISREATEQTFT